MVPASGPSAARIAEYATGEAEFEFVLIAVDAEVIERLNERRDPTFSSVMGQHARPPQRVVGVGDAVSVTIWEAGPGGLFSNAAAAAGPAAAGGSQGVSIPPQRVNYEGFIRVPFAGDIRALGRRPEEIADEIVLALSRQTIQPQVLVRIEESVVNQATVLGDVIAGGRIPLIGRNDRLLDVIAAAGNVSAPIYSVSVRLTRDGRSVEAPLHRVLTNASENIVVQPGDVITLFRDPETFTAFGATGRSTLASFDDEELTLDEALGKVGGVIDARGDPAGVFVFRFEPATRIAALRPDLEMPEDGLYPVAYQIDMRQPEGLFYARLFRMESKDVLFVANADASELRKVLGLIGAVLSPAATGVGLSQTVN